MAGCRKRGEIGGVGQLPRCRRLVVALRPLQRHARKGNACTSNLEYTLCLSKSSPNETGCCLRG
jgi:hypothetical protein